MGIIIASGGGIANDTCAAIEFNAGRYRIVKSRASAKVYKVYWRENEYYEIALKNTNEYRIVEDLGRTESTTSRKLLN